MALNNKDKWLLVGKSVLIGAGSIVVKDIPDNVKAYGNPCKVIRENTNI